MLNKKNLAAIRKDLLAYALKRRDIIKLAGDAQQMSKKAIFALQRDDTGAAIKLLEQAKKIFVEAAKKYKSEPDIFTEGSYRAALEEYTEATLFFQFCSGDTIGTIKGVEADSDTLVGGLCDLPGELYRYAIKSATARNFDVVTKCYKVAEEIISELVDMDLTGYNRQKFDQAKSALQKLEQVVYEISLKKM